MTVTDFYWTIIDENGRYIFQIRHAVKVRKSQIIVIIKIESDGCDLKIL